MPVLLNPMSATVTPGFDRWLDDKSRDDSASAADGAAADPDNANADPENPNSAKRFLTYAPFAKQCDFHKSPAKYRLFGGAAGPGKSMALLMEAVVQANDNMGSNTLLLRRTFPELEQSLLLYFRKEIPRELYSSFNDSKHVVTWLNGSTTRFGYCAAENDVYQYQGAEFLFIGIDELTLFTLRQWQFLTSRNRCPIAKTFPTMAGATNPGNIGHAWVKSLWIDKQPAAGMENPECYDTADYDFISARVHDNPIYAADQNYLKTLAALPSHLRRAFLDGDWEVFAGQYFDNFDVMRHIARAETIDWKPWWPRWISIDWGFEHPSATYWHAAAPGAAAVSSVGARACRARTRHKH
ncbi:MAG: terminase family protein [Candidatus Acidiferrales bacterium]